MLLNSVQAFANEKESKIILNEIKKINSMREGLVSGVQGEVSQETFKAVCKPVGLELKKLGSKYGVNIRQTSTKYRNPNHKANKMDKRVLEAMEKDKKLGGYGVGVDGGIHYYIRIDVQKACLNCHGAKNARPDFIKKKYPNDKAFGYKEGDLRGAYTVFLKDEARD
jgi:hypothetical protein